MATIKGNKMNEIKIKTFDEIEVEYYLGDFEKKNESIRVRLTVISRFIRSYFSREENDFILKRIGV